MLLAVSGSFIVFFVIPEIIQSIIIEHTLLVVTRGFALILQVVLILIWLL